MSEVDVKSMNGGHVSPVQKNSIVEQLVARGFTAQGKSGIYIKKNESPEGTLKANISKKVALFQTDDDAFETYDEVPELAEVQALLKGKTVEQVNAEAHENYGKRTAEDYQAKNMGQDMKERMETPVKDAPSSPAKNLPATVAPASSQTPATKKEFTHEIEGLPKELAGEMGVGDKKKKYAYNPGLWYVFYFLGLKLKTCKVFHEHWSWQKNEDDPRAGQSWVRCEIVLDDGSPNGQLYEAWGDATRENVKLDDVKSALDRMGETRAIDRVLRMITAGGWRINPNNITPQQVEIFKELKKCEACSAEELAQFGGDV